METGLFLIGLLITVITLWFIHNISKYGPRWEASYHRVITDIHNGVEDDKIIALLIKRYQFNNNDAIAALTAAKEGNHDEYVRIFLERL